MEIGGGGVRLGSHMGWQGLDQGKDGSSSF